VTESSAPPHDRGRPSRGSIGSRRSIGSIGSTHSIGSIGSAFSIGSIGSFASIGSIGSACSIGSIFSLLSLGSLAVAAGVGARSRRPGWLAPVLVAVAIASLVQAALRRGSVQLSTGAPNM
jgi:hypothetical protein